MVNGESGKRDHPSAESSSEPAGRPTETRAADGPGRIPRQIGHFHIKGVIASGGMGTVYQAVQEHPRRAVALKVMKHGITSRSALRRFEYESQILARLHHAGIAQVYEAGTHDDGTGAVPYFAMEYIPNARPITKYAKEKKLGVRERLELFGHVCNAVHHGHQKGIIHRDLKPGNILVDSAGEVKIIDFGVARGTDSDLAVTTVQTDIGQLIGTLQYMSPEQCQADPHDIDTRSDVYALGVVLYELLSGKPPYDVSHKPVYESTRLIREQQPTRLSTADRTLRGDVETIAFKALEKDRERRYQSATELAQDIRRYLSGEAIVARPPSIVYQFRVFARRNKALFAATAAIMAVLVVGVVVSTSLYVRSEAALEEAVDARAAAESARAAEQEQRRQAEEARTQAAHEARTAQEINAFLNRMLASVDPVKLNMIPTGEDVAGPTLPPAGAFAREDSVAEMLRWAVSGLEDAFTGKPELEAAVRETIGTTFSGLGLYEDAVPQLEKALEINKRSLGEDHATTLRSLFHLAEATRMGGREAEAIPMLRSALDRMEHVFGKEHPHTLNCARALACALNFHSQSDEANELFGRTLEAQRRVLGSEHRHTLATMCDWAICRFLRQEPIQAIALIREAFDTSRRTLSPDDYVRGCSEMLMGIAYMPTGNFPAAQSLLRPALESQRRILGENHPLTCLGMFSLAFSLQGEETVEEQEQLFRQALAGARARLGEAAWLTEMAHNVLSGLLTQRGMLDEAEKLCRQRLDACRQTLGEADHHTVRALYGLAAHLLMRGKLEEATRRYEEWVDLCAHVFGEEHATTLGAMKEAAEALFDAAMPAEARKHHSRLIAILRRKAQAPDADAVTINDLAWHLLTAVPPDLRDPSAALPLAQKAVEMSGGQQPGILDTLALAHHMNGDNDRALDIQRKAMAALSPEAAATDVDLLANMIRFVLHDGQKEEARRLIQQRVGRLRMKLGSTPLFLAQRLEQDAAWLMDEGWYELAEPLVRECLEIMARVLPEGDCLTMAAQCRLGRCLAGQGRHEEAETLLLEGYEGLSKDPAAFAVQRERAVKWTLELYEAWGKPDETAEWRAKLPTTQPVTEPLGQNP